MNTIHAFQIQNIFSNLKEIIEYTTYVIMGYLDPEDLVFVGLVDLVFMDLMFMDLAEPMALLEFVDLLQREFLLYC